MKGQEPTANGGAAACMAGWFRRASEWMEIYVPENSYMFMWAAIQLLLIGFLIFAFVLISAKDTIGAVSLALFALTFAAVVYSVIGSIALFSKTLRNRFSYGYFVGSSAMLASEMLLISIITGHDLAVQDKDDVPDAAESGVSIFAVVLAACYISISLLMWLRSSAILQSWEGHKISGNSAGGSKFKNAKRDHGNHEGEFDEIELI